MIYVRPIVIGLLLTAGLAAAPPRTKPPRTTTIKGNPIPVRIGKETTYLRDPPLNRDGTVNYAAYVAARYKKLIPLKDNALPFYVKAFGLDRWNEAQKKQLLKTCGMTGAEIKGPIFLSCVDYYKKQGREVKDPMEGEFSLATTPWSGSQYPEADHWLKAMRQPLKHLIQGSKRPVVQLTVFSPEAPARLVEAQLFSFGSLRSASRALCAIAMRELHAGKIESAWEHTMVVRRIARQCARNETIIGSLLGMAIERQGCSAQQSVLVHKSVSSDQLRAMLKQLQSLRPFPSLKGAMQIERLCALDCIMSLACNPPFPETDPDEFTITDEDAANADFNIILRRVNAVHDQIQHALRQPTVGKRTKAFKALGKDLDEQVAEARRRIQKGKPDPVQQPNDPKSISRQATQWVSNWVVDASFYSGFGRAQAIRDATLTRSQMIELVAALSIYRSEHGCWPSKLGDLTPKILKSVPADPWTEKPYVYQQAEDGFCLSSEGFEREEEDRGTADDPFLIDTRSSTRRKREQEQRLEDDEDAQDDAPQE